MLNLEGDAVLALWNGIEPARRRDYDVWHSREHVPERLSVPGMRGARRYVRAAGPLPEFLTLYAMDDTGVLQSAPYRALLDNPTAWSRSMRPSFRGFMRLCSRRLFSVGHGLGGCLAAVVVDSSVTLAAPKLRETLTALLANDAIVAAHALERDLDVPDVPFSIGGPPPDFPNAGALLFEGYDGEQLAAAAPTIAVALAPHGIDPAATLTQYSLAYALSARSTAPDAFRRRP